ncbi:MAG: 3-deoxy-manno-octulosonate cytidylyltransferase [Oscillospiraceae bacterium]|nr:3-deoxy-manno-octulosonate cytidylyltransferase [Oscillospiraceae bacterium]
MKTIGIIPARYGSSRLPGKPLKDILGKPMIQHVYERASRAKRIDELIVATDDERIVAAVEAFGGKAMLTAKDHPTGSDRIAEVARRYECDNVINIQGDEPLIMPEIIDEITEALISDPSLVMATGCYQIPEALYHNPNVVKVVFDREGYAMMFSRSLIPYPRKAEGLAVYEHIGIYAYTRDFLMKYVTLPQTPLSTAESLEQLKVMENGYRIKVVPTKFGYNALSVDTQEDLDEVIRIMKERGEG